MPRKNRNSAMWADCRAFWEGEQRPSSAQVALQFGVTRQSVNRRVRLEKWHRTSPTGRAPDDPNEPNAVEGRVLPSLLLPKGPFIDAVADAPEELKQEARSQRTEIILRHREELMVCRSKIYTGLKDDNMVKVKLGKEAAMALKLIQEGERKSWGIDHDDARKDKPPEPQHVTESRY
jgi:hypothetical protein